MLGILFCTQIIYKISKLQGRNPIIQQFAFRLLCKILAYFTQLAWRGLNSDTAAGHESTPGLSA